MAEIQSIGVIGAGQMGRGIAQVAAQKGLGVVLLDASLDLAQAGRGHIERGFERLVKKGSVTASEVGSVLARITPSADYAALSTVDCVIEAATERFEIKEAIFRRADEAAKTEAILASNTSSISITKLAAVTRRPEQVIGMHFFNPVPVMKLVEVIRALQTSDATYARIAALAQTLDKSLVTARDMPGFLVNRILVPLVNEACFALQEGLGSIEDIDRGAKLGLNHPMGPFELADFVGLDTLLYIAEVLQREFGDDKYRPAPLLRNYVAAGWLGRKSGRGFYVYDGAR